MSSTRLRWRDALPIVVAAVFMAYGLYLLAVGQLETIVTPGDGSVTVQVPTTAGLVPLVTGGLVLYGIWTGRDRVVWAGAVFALGSGVAFLFSLAGFLIPMAILLLAALALRQLLARRQASTG